MTVSRKQILWLSFLGVFLLIAFATTRPASMVEPEQTQASREILRTPVSAPEGKEIATFGSGCFWCLEAVFQETPGITSSVSGYGGGQEAFPTYGEVISGVTTHRESVQVLFDPSIITYEEILEIFWQNIDPTDNAGQFVDRGFSYTAAIFYHDDSQKEIAMESIEKLDNSEKFNVPVVTPVIDFTTFYDAEEYHQDYYKKDKINYKKYSEGSGRDQYKQAVWEEIQSNQ